VSQVFAQAAGFGVTLKVEYADVAGSYGGWFLLVVHGDNLQTDTDFNPANGPSCASPLSTGLGYSGSLPLAAPGLLVGGTGVPNYREPFLRLVNNRLNRMFGEGHSATWTATIVESVTPAVIDDNW
jgi:hypothetical protein